MDRVELLRVFCMAAESLNFRAAAVRLGRSPQDVTRAVNELEERFGEVLFHRSTRKVQITAFGKVLAERARAVLTSVEDLFQDGIQRATDDISGLVRIAAPAALGRRYVFPALAQLAQIHPNLTFELCLSERLADVVDERIDLGVRIGLVRDQRFVARPSAKVGLHLVAAPALLRRTGTPATVRELASFPVTALIDANSGRAWPWYFRDGQQFVPATPAFTTDDPENELHAVLAGLGIGQLPGYLATPHIRSGELVPLLEDLAPLPWDVYVYRPQQSPVPARVRLVFDSLISILSSPDYFPA